MKGELAAGMPGAFACSLFRSTGCEDVSLKQRGDREQFVQLLLPCFKTIKKKCKALLSLVRPVCLAMVQGGKGSKSAVSLGLGHHGGCAGLRALTQELNRT